MSMIIAKNIWKKYDDNVVLEQVNTEIKEGEFITIVGTSGCGKTTFLRMLLGIESPSSGELLLDGKSFPDEPDEKRGIVFQRYSVFPHLTVLQNTVLGLELEQAPILGKLFGAKKREAEEKAKEMLTAVGLS
ncbi:MAG: ATP-binding cassette domain-containing protein, partial [Gammaproteobacteria bacterium]|nr:ATP-binding cassette domain-containing protein [Gammaproteobacteria bacterium]